MHVKHLLALVAGLAITFAFAVPHPSHPTNTAHRNSYLARHDDFVTHLQPPSRQKVLARDLNDNRNADTEMIRFLKFWRRKKVELFHSTQFKIHGFGKRDVDEDGPEEQPLSQAKVLARGLNNNRNAVGEMMRSLRFWHLRNGGLFHSTQFKVRGFGKRADEQITATAGAAPEVASDAAANDAEGDWLTVDEDSDSEYESNEGFQRRDLRDSVSAAVPHKSTSVQTFTGSLGDLLAGLTSKREGGQKQAPGSGYEELLALVAAAIKKQEHEHSRRDLDDLSDDSGANLQRRDLHDIVAARGKISAEGHLRSTPTQLGHVDIGVLRHLMTSLEGQLGASQHRPAGSGEGGLIDVIAAAARQHKHPRRDADEMSEDSDEDGLWSSGFANEYFDEDSELED